MRHREDGRYRIDTNLVENSIRPKAAERISWFFIGHPNAAWPSAVIHSQWISARRCGLDPGPVAGGRPAPHPHRQLLPADYKPQSV